MDTDAGHPGSLGDRGRVAGSGGRDRVGGGGGGPCPRTATGVCGPLPGRARSRRTRPPSRSPPPPPARRGVDVGTPAGPGDRPRTTAGRPGRHRSTGASRSSRSRPGPGTASMSCRGSTRTASEQQTPRAWADPRLRLRLQAPHRVCSSRWRVVAISPPSPRAGRIARRGGGGKGWRSHRAATPCGRHHDVGAQRSRGRARLPDSRSSTSMAVGNRVRVSALARGWRRARLERRSWGCATTRCVRRGPPLGPPAPGRPRGGPRRSR